MDSKNYKKLEDFIGKAVPNVVNWNQLDLNYRSVAQIEQKDCIHCGLCYIACEDTSHQAVLALKNSGQVRYEVNEQECVGCNLCALVCPVTCISMVSQKTEKPYLPWTRHPNNPNREVVS